MYAKPEERAGQAGEQATQAVLACFAQWLERQRAADGGEPVVSLRATHVATQTWAQDPFSTPEKESLESLF